MLMKRSIARLISIGIMLLGASVAFSQDYPNKPIRIVAAQAGGTGDIVARLVARGLSGGLGQQVIVENRGGSVVIHAQIVAKALPDGYTLTLYGSSFWIGPLMRNNTPYDVVRDFSPIALVASTPIVLVVHPSLPVKSVKELIALAKSRPGELDYAVGATGSINHLAAELFKSTAGVNIVHIPFKGSAPALLALFGGEVQVSFPTAGAVTPFLKPGKLRALAVTSAEPSALLPGLPTMAASGFPGYKVVTVYGMFAPAHTPATIINRLSEETKRSLNSADVKAKLFSYGIEVVGSSPEEFAAWIKSEMETMGQVVKDAGIRVD